MHPDMLKKEIEKAFKQKTENFFKTLNRLGSDCVLLTAKAYLLNARSFGIDKKLENISEIIEGKEKLKKEFDFMFAQKEKSLKRLVKSTSSKVDKEIDRFMNNPYNVVRNDPPKVLQINEGLVGDWNDIQRILKEKGTEPMKRAKKAGKGAYVYYGLQTKVNKLKSVIKSEFKKRLIEKLQNKIKQELEYKFDNFNQHVDLISEIRDGFEKEKKEKLEQGVGLRF